MKKKVTIVGPTPRDHITTADNELIVRYGCITSPTVALGRLLGTDAEIIPVTHVRKNDEASVKELFFDMPNVSLDYVSSAKDQGAVFDLLYLNDVDRIERQIGYMNPFEKEEFADLLDSDVIMFTTCTDYELPLDTLRYVRQNSKATIILSAHGPTTTVNVKGARQLRFWIERDLCLPYIDILVMNIKEAQGCWFQKEFAVAELDAKREFTPNEAHPMAHHFLNMGLKALYITSLNALKGIVYYGNADEMQSAQFATQCDKRIVDTTGCAEAFVGGIVYGILTDKDYVDSAWYATKLAEQRITSLELDAFVSANEMEALRQQV